MNSTTAFRIAAIFGFAAVALGAFGAHGLKPILEANGTTAIWQTGALYHLVHSAVLLFISGREPLSVWAWRLFVAGMLIFSGTRLADAFRRRRGLSAGATSAVGAVFLGFALKLSLASA